MNKETELSLVQLPPLYPITKARPEALDLVDMVLSQLVSSDTRRMYRYRLVEFIRNREVVDAGVQGLTREAVGNYLAWMDTQGHGIAARNQSLSAIKLLAREAELRGLITGDGLRGIQLISHIKQPGVRSGNWLTADDLARFYMLPDRGTVGGLRDAVILALMCACGLRRREAVSICWDRYQEREGRMVLVDLVGKGNRIRTVVVPEWAEKDLNNWYDEMQKYQMGGPDQKILTGLPTRDGGDWREQISPERVWQVVKRYALKLEWTRQNQDQGRTDQGRDRRADRAGFKPKLSPHDLRRTLARLMYMADANLIEIQMTLGHASVETTQKYLGSMQLKLGRGVAAVDKIKMNFEERKKVE